MHHGMKKPFGGNETVWYLPPMPTTLDPGKLRPALHAKIDEMDGEALAILHRVALQLELDRLSGEVDAEFDSLREQGRLDRLPEILREARDAIRARGAA
jgi:hypothetical protein